MAAGCLGCNQRRDMTCVRCVCVCFPTWLSEQQLSHRLRAASRVLRDALIKSFIRFHQAQNLQVTAVLRDKKDKQHVRKSAKYKSLAKSFVQVKNMSVTPNQKVCLSKNVCSRICWMTQIIGLFSYKSPYSSSLSSRSLFKHIYWFISQIH